MTIQTIVQSIVERAGTPLYGERRPETLPSVRMPLVEEVPFPLSPAQAFDAHNGRPYSFLLDSGMTWPQIGRYSFAGSSPFLVLRSPSAEGRSRGRSVTLSADGESQSMSADPFEVLRGLLASFSLSPGESPVPLNGGAVGYLSYDLGRLLERLPDTAVDDLALPEMYLGFYDVVLAVDDAMRKAYIVSTGFPETDESRRMARARSRLDEEKARLAASRKRAPTTPGQSSGAVPPVILASNFTHEEYVRAVQKARQYIIDGDIFEVNLSQRFEGDIRVHPYDLYRRLRRINPAPFAAYLEFPEVSVVSASPERFIRLSGDRVETRPIKGTRPRGKTPQEDEALARELLSSEKDKAENTMIVDLERNDLGRVCRYGTVRVKELHGLETFPTVFHLTSTVVGQLREGVDRTDLLRATFPGGSITGAPKVRTMEIIEVLEPTRRSVYTGSLGYLSFSGELDLNIVIRTILVKGRRAYFQVGGAVVYDSDPEGEYQETLHKGRALVRALNATGEGGLLL